MISDGWSLAVQKSGAAYEKLQEANVNGSMKEQLDAWTEFQLAEDAREIATLEAGFGPAWPPRTELGLRYMGITREQCHQMIAKFNTKN